MNRECLKVYTASAWQLNGQYWTAPVTMVVEGVMCGSHGCQFWPGDVIRAMAGAWHDIPVSVDHPQINGVAVSINHSPEVFAAHAVGYVRNPRYDPGTRALKAVIKVPQGIRGLEQIMTMREVSIGVFTNQVREEGQFNGKRYIGRTTKADPDHLALLAGPGACDWTAGCGVRTHRSELDELKEIAGRTITNWVNDTLKGARSMTNFEHEGVFPPEVYQANKEREELATLAAWEGNPNPPMEVLELRRKHGQKQGQGRGGGYHDEANYPPEVTG